MSLVVTARFAGTDIVVNEGGIFSEGVAPFRVHTGAPVVWTVLNSDDEAHSVTIDPAEVQCKADPSHRVNPFATDHLVSCEVQAGHSATMQATIKQRPALADAFAAARPTANSLASAPFTTYKYTLILDRGTANEKRLDPDFDVTPP